jgi:HEAT repeats
MLTKYLSENERLTSQKKLYTFQALNGIGFNFMGETPVYLMAIHFGASNIELGYISSVIFLTGFILVVLPRLLSGKNLVKVQATAWFFRGLVVLMYLALFFLDGKPAVLLILIVYTLFCSFRMIGVSIWNPLIKMVTTSQNRGIVLAQGNIANQTGSVLSKLVSVLVTSVQYFSGITGILLLQVIGVIFNSAASIQLKKIPCRETVEYEKGRNIFIILKESMINRDRRYPLTIKWITVAIMVINSLTIVFIKKEAGFSSNFVFLYSMFMTLAIILSGLFARTFSDRMGSRPLLMGVNILLTISFIFWMVLPVSQMTDLPIYIYFFLGFISNFFLFTTNVLCTRVLVNTMPENESFSYNAMTNFVTAFFAFISGIVGGVLIDLGQNSGIELSNTYSFLFSFAIILTLVLVFLSFKLIDKGSLSTRETAAILFSLDGMKAYIDIGKLNTTEDPVKKRTVLLSISRNDASIATEEMRTIIASPLSSEKEEVIKSLFNHPRPELLPELMKEASDSGSYHQIPAIFALGAYSGKKVERLLLELLDRSEPSVKSNAAKSLGRIGHHDSLEKIRLLSREADQVWDKINYLIALKNMDPTGQVFQYLYQDVGNFSESIFRQTYYSLNSDLLQFKPPLSTIYSSKNLQRGEGLSDFLEQTRDLDFFYENHKELKTWFRKGNWISIWEFCRQSLERCKPEDSRLSDPLKNLRQALIDESEKSTHSKTKNSITQYDDALAAVYFTYQILVHC